MTRKPKIDPSTTGNKLSSILTRALLIGGGFLAAWGTLVTVALLVILVIQGPGSGGYVPFLAGGVVIGLAPIFFGGILFHFGRERSRESQSDNERL